MKRYCVFFLLLFITFSSSFFKPFPWLIFGQEISPTLTATPSAFLATPSATVTEITPTLIPSLAPLEAAESANLRPSFKLENKEKTIVFNQKTPEFKLISGIRFKPEIKIYNHANEIVDVNIKQTTQNSDVVYQLENASELPPGKYQITLIDELGGEINQDFYWGVLAINFNKSIYHPYENAYLSMAVLDETGAMVCDAKLTLSVTKPDGDTDELSTENGAIIVNPECQIHDYTEKPDYEAQYAFGQDQGIYHFILTAETKNGSYSIDDQIEITNNIPLEVDRILATRIYPPKTYSATINLKANEDFIGIISEKVPASFIISKNNQNGITNYDEVVDDTATSAKIIKWNLSLPKDQEITIGYSYDIPDISPELYFIGPLKLTDTSGTITFFEEKRLWQLAADALLKIRQEVNLINGIVNTGGTDAAIVNLDTTKYNGAAYYFEVIAKVTSGTTTINLSTGNTNTVGIGVSDTSFVRVRQAFTPESGSFDYRLNLVNGTSPQVKAARVVIIQNAAYLTDTQTQIEIGNLEIGLTMGTTQPLNSPKYWKYDSSLWDGTVTFSAEITYKAGVAVTAGSQTFTDAGVNTYSAAIGLTSVKVECWGGGGGGGGSNTTTDGCGGGGGGAYSNKLNLSITGGVGYTAFVGVGGTSAAAIKGGPGGVTYFGNGVGTTFVSAAGGIGGTSQAGGAPGAGGAGGSSAAGVGDTKWSGGAGGRGSDASAGQGGPGGSSAGIGGTGWSGASTWATLVASTGPAGSGIGGSGGPANTNGAAPGSGNGGGGGGSGDKNGGIGGFGANGKVVVTWGAVGNAVTAYLQQDNGSFSGWTNIATILSGGTETVPTHVGVTNVTLSNGKNYRIVVQTAGVPFDIYNAKIVVNQTSTTSITKLEPQYLLLNTKSTSIGDTLGFQTIWDSAEWVRTTNVYKHAQDAIGASANSRLVDIDNGNAVLDNSSITGANQTVGNAITMPTTNHRIDTWLVAAGTEVDASRILVQVTINAYTIDISGFCKKYDQLTDCSDSETIRYAVGATLMSSTATISGGTWVFTGQTVPSDNSIITVYISGVGISNRANTVTKYTGSGSNLVDIYLYENHLTIGHSGGTISIGNTNLANYDNSVAGAGTSEVFFDVDIGNTLTTDIRSQFGQHKLFVFSGNEFRPGSSGSNNITADNVEIGGTLTTDSNTITLSSSWTNNGTFQSGTGNVTFIDNLKTSNIYYGGIGSTQPFYNLTISTPGKQMKFDETEMTGVGGTLTVQGSDCTNQRVFLDSTTDDNPWDIDVTAGDTDIDYADIEDSNAIAAISADNSTGSNNTNWAISGGACSTGPLLDQLLRHGQWFSSSGKQPFTF